MAEFDYIIIGGGSAGCVLADKLSADGRHNVLLLEAGPSDRRFWVRMPIGYGSLFHDRRVNWMYDGAPEDALGGRSAYHPRGRVLGGSSSINALVYHRGQAGDYDDWQAAGNPGWGYDDVSAVFDSFEHPRQDQLTDDMAHDAPNGPHLSVTDNTAECHAFGATFMSTCKEAQVPSSSTPFREGEGVSSYLMTTRRGMRCSTATAFLWPAMKRANLQMRTNAMVRRIGFESGRAVSVSFRHKGGETTLRARREIILSAGAVGTPQILQLSGVGDGASLQKLGLDVVQNQPAVGQNMQDHFGINYFFKANQPTLNDVFGSWRGRLAAGLRYVLTRRGPLSLSVNQYGGLVRTRPDQQRADCQLYMNPLSYYSFHDGRRRLMRPDQFSGFIIGFNSCRPASCGSVTITSPDAEVHPRIHGNYLDHQQDCDDAVRMARFVQRLQAAPALKAALAEDPMTPLADMDDTAVIDDFRERGGTVFHLCGTCRMGPDSRDAVVDPQLRVHGIGGLRIVDASVFPNITSANTNAPTIMLAHKAAKMILADAG
jgi:choline dehydrogenase